MNLYWQRVKRISDKVFASQKNQGGTQLAILDMWSSISTNTVGNNS